MFVIITYLKVQITKIIIKMATTANFTNIKIMEPECLMSLQTDIRTDSKTESFKKTMSENILVRFCNKTFHIINFIIWEILNRFREKSYSKLV